MRCRSGRTPDETACFVTCSHAKSETYLSSFNGAGNGIFQRVATPSCCRRIGVGFLTKHFLLAVAARHRNLITELGPII